MGFLDYFFYTNNKQAPEPVQAKAQTAPIVYPLIGTGGVNWFSDNSTQYITNGYTSNPVIYSIVKQISDKIAAVPFYLYTIEKDKHKDFKRYKSFSSSNNLMSAEAFKCKSTSMKEVDSHPIMSILDQPNPNQGWSDFVKEVVGYKLVTGNSYIYGAMPEFGVNKDKIISLTALPAQLMNIVSNNNQVEYYNLIGNNQRLEKENVLHLKYWNPDFSSSQNVYGMSPLRAGLKVMSLNNEAYNTQGAVMANRGAYGMLSATGSESPEQLQQLKDRFKNAETGEIMIVASELKWTQFGQPSDELQILESMGLNLRDLCNLYGFPSLLLGDDTQKTYSNYEQAVKSMVFNTVVPLITELRDNLNKWLVPAYSKADGKQYFIDFDISVLPELATDMDKLIAQLAQQYWLTPNEKRAAVKYGTLPDPAMDKVYMPQGLVPIDELSIQIDTGKQDLSDYQ
ncbi:phage portal protein [Pedobacter sp. MC2016-24]|uniref:phage portal protein n=1 Tax=Pedobacter sp. MC2016-24 TaxID=2780090 RepID=UPI00187E3B5E|nr:phage portal protein [Pedobacter sp. MC2016-24]